MKKYSYLAAAALLSLTSCSKKDEKQAVVADETPIVEVDVAGMRTIQRDHSYTANVEAFNVNNISPAGMNRIKSIHADVGDRVSRGQVLVVMDNSSATQLKVNLDQLERSYQRAVQLLQIGSGTQATVDAAKAQLDAARAQYANVLENVRLTSPVSGVVIARNYDPGDMTSGQPVLTIGQVSPAVKVVINIPEVDRTKVRAGMPVEVSLDAFEGETFNGSIARVYPTVDPSTRTFQAEVTLPNPQGRINPGMFARVMLSQGSDDCVVVPDRAVVKQTGSGNRFVYVYRNGKVSYNKVELGQRVDNGYEVISGVANGDTVVIAGQIRLADGVKAMVKK